MLRDIVAFEWRYHTRQISFAAAVLMFVAFGFAVTATGFGPDNVHIDSPYSIAQSIGMLSLLSVFVLAVFCANAVVRDRETQMEEIVYTTSVEKLPFLLGRFTGSFLAAFTAFSASVLGMFLARFMPWQDAGRLGAANPLPYFWALLVIALPNLLFAAAILFTFSTITRSVLASYAGSVLVYVLYFAAAAATNSPLMAASAAGASEGGASLAALLDPFALSAFFEQTQHWTPAERNTRLLALSGNFLLNRLLWISAAFALFGAVYRFFSFRVVSESRKPAKAMAAEAPVATTHYRPVPTSAEPVTQWSAYLSATAMEIRTFVLSRPMLAMTLLWVALAVFELISEISGGEYGSATYPAAGVVFSVIDLPLSLLTTILLIYTSAEMVWRERTLRVSEILHATPAANAVFVASKCTALAALVGVMTATGYLAGALLQLSKGWPVAPGLLLSFAWFSAAPLVLFAVAAVVVQTLSPHKYLGMLLVLLLAMLIHRGEIAGLEHPLLRFANAPAVGWSDLNGFGRAAGFQWLMLYWAAAAGLCLLLAIALWRHGAGGLRTLGRILRRTSGAGRLTAATLLVLFLATGAFIFYNTNVLNAHETSSERLDWRTDYEKQYHSFAALPQPRVRRISAAVDLFPEEGRYRVRGEYVLANDSATPIDTVLVGVRRDADAAKIALDTAKQSAHDGRFAQHVFRLAPALAPGAQTTLRFDVTYENRGFESSDPDYTIAANGSYIPSDRAFPMIGYRESYEIRDPHVRRRRGLPARPAPEESRELLQHDDLPSAEWVAFDVTVSTPRDQVAVAPGRLVGQWEREGRRGFHFRSDAPIPRQFIIASARYAVARETHRGVSVEIYHHPAHTQNVARMMRAAAESLAYYEQHFAPYPHRHLRIAEVGAHFPGFSGFAQPGVVFLGENRGFLIDARDPRRLDLVHRRVSHEIAHQWFGYTLVPADAPGASILTESLTKYAELMVMEKTYGRERVGESLAYELDRYLKGRTGESGAEPPLTRAGNQPYLFYRKGAMVMYALKDLLGEATVNTALRNLLREQGGPDRKPTIAHFLQHLRAVAPTQHHALIDEWLTDVILYDLKLTSATSRRLADGRHEVTLRITAAKHRIRETAEEPLAFAEALEVGLFAPDGKPLYLAKHALRDGAQDVVVVVEKEPLSAAIDPYLCRIDRNAFDNTVRVEGR